MVPMTNPASAADARFCQLLRHLRHRRGLSLRQFAQLVHFSHTYLWEIESGRKPATAHIAAVPEVIEQPARRAGHPHRPGRAHGGRNRGR
jgi:DNA-binding transcriptional regulator YiaG